MTSFVRRAGDAVRAWHARRASIRELSALDDHTLADIGVPRTELSAVIYGLLTADALNGRSGFSPPTASAGGSVVRDVAGNGGSPGRG